MKTNPLKAALALTGIHFSYRLRYEVLKQNGFGHKLPPHRIEGKLMGFNYVIEEQIPGKGWNQPHRIKFKCDCGKYIPVGRIGQHVCDSKLPDDYIVLVFNSMAEKNLDKRAGGWCFTNGSYIEKRLS